jgi:glutathione S-transferase
MKLIGSLTSPYVRKARVVLAEKKIDYEFRARFAMDTGKPGGQRQSAGQNPGPSILDDNTVLFDSRVIVEYLDNVAPNNKLMPGQNRERSEVKRWEALADGVCDAAALVFLEKKRPAAQQSCDWIARQEDKIIRSLEFMSKNLATKAWCMGTHFSLADVDRRLRARLSCLPFPEIDWQESTPTSPASTAR